MGLIPGAERDLPVVTDAVDSKMAVGAAATRGDDCFFDAMLPTSR